MATLSSKRQIPQEFSNVSNPYAPLMMQVASATQWNETAEAFVYTGPEDLGRQWEQIFDTGKELFTQKCLSCHGCSGNGMGPYARTTVTRPADLHERISRFPGDFFHYWRVSQGVPGTYMPDWGNVLDNNTIFYIMTYEMSFADQTGHRAIRTVSGDISDAEGDDFNDRTNIMPGIEGSSFDFMQGMGIFNLYCAQCHGNIGQGEGPASNESRYGYITPAPANFTESGGDFPNYGRWVWKVQEGVETTNMPPWKWVLNDTEIFRVIFYEQSFSTPDDYNSKWAPLYSDDFGKNLMLNNVAQGSFSTFMPACLIILFVILGHFTKHIFHLKTSDVSWKKPTEKILKWRHKTWV